VCNDFGSIEKFLVCTDQAEDNDGEEVDNAVEEETKTETATEAESQDENLKGEVSRIL